MATPKKNSSRDSRISPEQPSWDENADAGPKESTDARIRRMSMQMASAERSGFRGERTDLYGGLPLLGRIAVWAAGGLLVLGALTTLVLVFRKEPEAVTREVEKPSDAIAALMETVKEYSSAEVEEEEASGSDSTTWLSTDLPEFEQIQKTVEGFMAASSASERSGFIIQTGDANSRLREYENHAIFEQSSNIAFAENFCSGDGWASVDMYLPAFGYRPIILSVLEDGRNLIDLDAFLGHNVISFERIRNRIHDDNEETFRALATFSQEAVDSPGDILVVLRPPNDTILADRPIFAVLSKFGETPEHIISWLEIGAPLPFTVTAKLDRTIPDSKVVRVTKIQANAWSSGLTPTPVVLAPPSELLTSP